MGNANEDTKVKQFQNYPEADGLADEWYLGQEEKKSWVTIKASIGKGECYCWYKLHTWRSWNL